MLAFDTLCTKETVGVAFDIFFSCLPFALHVITWWQQVGLVFFQPFLSSDAELKTLRMTLGLFKHTIRDDIFKVTKDFQL